MTPELYHPVLDCFMRGLPHAYRDLDAEEGSVIQIEIAGECGGIWLLKKGDAGWSFTAELQREPSAKVVIPQEIAWRVFTKGIDRRQAQAASSIAGEHILGVRVFHLTAIVG
jgi:hypothetical protein